MALQWFTMAVLGNGIAPNISFALSAQLISCPQLHPPALKRKENLPSRRHNTVPVQT